MKFSKPGITKPLLILAAILLGISIFVPLWQIFLDAPQYPEGLKLVMYPNKLAGDVEIINGLNHYIGMKTLHTDDFVEFKVLPYIIGFFSVLFLATAFVGRKKMLYVSMILFVLFGILAMYDFWRWEYQYGHDLDPKAAIQVPGMAYQPPLIGFKQLLNFGAYSIPALGGWLFIGAGLAVLAACIIEWKNKAVTTVHVTKALVFAALLGFASCGAPQAEPIALNKDNCAECKMTIADLKFANELVTDKGRVYKFDDHHCLVKYVQNNGNMVGKAYFSDFNQPQQLLNEEEAVLVKSDALRAPMGGNVVAFRNQEDAKTFLADKKGEVITWRTEEKK